MAHPSTSPRAKGVAGPARLLLARSGPVAGPGLFPDSAFYTFRPKPRAAPLPRLSLSAWSFVRGSGDAPLASGGMLGGSQAGARLLYRVAGTQRPLSATVRVTSPLAGTRGAEAAAGLDWKLLRSLPVRLLAERRQKLGAQGRNAFALTAYGGLSDVRLAGFRLDAYAQAGVVGTRARDLFADGAATVTRPIAAAGKLRAGAGAWGAAQPGVSRLDVGPTVAVNVPVSKGTATLALDWRFRVAGDARPGSGPALTLSTGF